MILFAHVKNIGSIIGGCSLLLLASVLEGAGVAALKEQKFHDDKAAKPLIYSNFIDEGTPVIVFKINEKSVTIDKTKIAGMVNIPDSIPIQIIDESGVVPLRLSLKEMTVFSERFPQMKPLLEKHIESITSHIEKFDSGNIRYGGVWKSKDEYAVILEAGEKQIKELQEENAKREEEKKAFEAEQLAKGLTKYHGKWLDSNQLAEAKELELEQIEKAEENRILLGEYEALKRQMRFRSKVFTPEFLDDLTGSLNKFVVGYRISKTEEDKMVCAKAVIKLIHDLSNEPLSNVISKDEWVIIFAKALTSHEELIKITEYHDKIAGYE